MSSTTCPSCQATLPAGAQFCTSCGHRLDAAPLQQESSPPQEPPAQDAPPAPTSTPPAPDQWAQAPTTQVPASAPPPHQTPEAHTPPQHAHQAPPPGWSAPQTVPVAPQQGTVPQSGSWSPPPGQHPGQQQWGAPPATHTAPAGTSSGGASPLAGILGLVGGVLAAISPFLAWFSVKAPGGDGESYTLWKILTGGDDVGLESPDAIFLLITGLVTIALGVLVLKSRSKPLSILLIVAGAIAIIIGVRDWMSISDLASDLPSSVTIDGGIGLYLAYAAGGLAAVGGILGLVLGGSKKAV